MTEIIKITLVGIVGVFIAMPLKKYKPEYGMIIGYSISLIIFCYGMTQIEAVLGYFSTIKMYLGGGEGYLAVLLKVIGITYICEFGAGICKDAGYGAVAEQIEMIGKLSVIFAGVPILFAVVEQIHGLA